MAPDPLAPADTERVAHLEVWATLRAIAGRALDGYRLYQHLVAAPANTPWGAVAILDADKPALIEGGDAARRSSSTSMFQSTDGGLCLGSASSRAPLRGDRIGR